MKLTSRRRPEGLRAPDTLAHWMRPGTQVLRLDASPPTEVEFRGAPAGTRVSLVGQQLANGDPDDGMPPDEMVAYDALMATEDHWMLRLWSYDRDKREYGARWTKLRLRLNRRTVFAQLGTPAGIPCMWNHFTWGNTSLGRVSTMVASDQKLTGAIALSSAALAMYGTSPEQIDRGMNAGLSIGVTLIDAPKAKRADGDDGGTFDRPDELIYGRIRVREVSLTATPMIAQAGILGRTGDSDG